MHKSINPSVFEDMISITEFNKGRAGKIFESVKTGTPKVVLRNNVPECVLISPTQYQSLLNELEDRRLLLLCAQRLENHTSKNLLTSEDVNKKYGVSEADLSNSDEVEFE